MKKKSILLAALLLTGVCGTSLAVDEPYVDYLYSDTNYPIIDGKQGYGSYVDLTSISVIKNDQFGVEFEVNVLQVNHNKPGWENSQPTIWPQHFFKNYAEPNSMYYRGDKASKYAPLVWKQMNLTDTSGTAIGSNRTFKYCMEHITGKPYRY